MRNIVAGMDLTGAKRLLAVSSVGVEDDPNAPVLGRYVMFPFVLKNVLDDLRAMEAQIVASGLTYTIVVRPVRLADGPRTGLYRANERFAPPGGRAISRADVCRLPLSRRRGRADDKEDRRARLLRGGASSRLE